ncbi:MAG: N-6 DNA methylase [Candidatus Methanofastidiosia archaeon]
MRIEGDTPDYPNEELLQRTIDGRDSTSMVSRKGRKKKNSEFQSYVFVKNDLREKGWNVANPARNPSGQLYTQHECHNHSQFECLMKRKTPEYIVKLREDAFWVIEAKGSHDDLDMAYNEAAYKGKKINRHEIIRARMISGVAGNDIDRYLIKSGYWNEEKKEYIPITYNGQSITSLLSPDMARRILDQDSPDLKDYEIDETYLAKIAEKINEKFHLSSIKKDQRASIVATMLLSLLGETEPNYNASPSVFVTDINTRAREVLEAQNKENILEYIEIKLPEKQDLQNKFRESLVTAFFLLKKVDIKAAMKTGSDVLGKFYETFLKYGNGAKDLGILLTPRQITEFAAKVLDIDYRDIVYDPCCGTGGFLVSAFYHVKSKSAPEQLDRFKQHRIFGLDQQPTVAALAIVNMLFRGDGKNNISNNTCFAAALDSEIIKDEPSAKFISLSEVKSGAKIPVTRVLMNPPFALKKKDEKEYKFIEHALSQMDHGGILFSIFPSSGMVKSGSYKSWRNRLKRENTLLSVLSLPQDLFYPNGTPTVAIIVKKGIPQPESQNVLWLRITSDGYRKSKGKRLPDPAVSDDLKKIKDLLSSFIKTPGMLVENIPEFQMVAPIDPDDTALELLPEVYLDERKPSEEEIDKGLDIILRDMISFVIMAKKEEEFKREIVSEAFLREVEKKRYVEFRKKPITEFLDIEIGKYHVSRTLDEGNVPLISCSAENNGVEGFFDIPEAKTYKDAITVASDGQPLASFYHYYRFAAKDNVLVGFPKKRVRFTTIIYILFELNRLRWRFSYGRKCYGNKIDKINIHIPISKDGKIDEDYIEWRVKNTSSWLILRRLFS